MRFSFSPKLSRSPGLTFPTEVYARIFEFVQDRTDLVTLCTVSRAFHLEAERVLYGSVDLSNDHLLIMLWFKKIANDPRLAAHVHSLTFGIVYADIPTPEYTWFEIIATGLRALVNLTVLNLHKKSSKFIDSRFAWIIRDHPFRLKVFRNDMFDLPATLSFLKSQPTIVVWEQRNATQCSVPHDILPLVTDVALDPWMLSTFSSRPLIRLAMKIESEGAASECQFVDIVGAYGQCLRSLDLVRHLVEESMPMAQFIGLISLKLPLLQSLSIRNKGEMTTDSTVQSFVGPLSSFHHLATLHLFPSRGSNRDSLYMSTLTSDGRIKVASDFFRSSSSLQRITLPTASGGKSWYAKSMKVAMVGDTIIKETTPTQAGGRRWVPWR